MRSKIIRAASIDEILERDGWAPQIDENQVRRQVDQYCVKYKAYQPGDTVAEGDIVSVELQSEEARFNRRVKINVGKGFFDRELEEKLTGLKCGESAVISHSSGEITVRVTDIQRLVIPELTDELARRGDLDGVHTAEEFRSRIRRKLAEEQITNRAYDCLAKAVAESEFAFDEAELSDIVEREMDRCREIARENDMVFDEMTEEQLLGAVGQPDIPSFKQMVREMGADEIGGVLLHLRWVGQDKTAEEASVAELHERYGDAIAWLTEKITAKVSF